MDPQFFSFTRRNTHQEFGGKHGSEFFSGIRVFRSLHSQTCGTFDASMLHVMKTTLIHVIMHCQHRRADFFPFNHPSQNLAIDASANVSPKLSFSAGFSSTTLWRLMPLTYRCNIDNGRTL